MELDAKIEAILYYRAEPVTYQNLSQILGESEEIIKEAVGVLKEKLKSRGLALIEETDSVEMRTASEASSLIESMIKDDDSRELTKSALETLSIVLYKGPVSRREIDFIRGVNSSFILRTLSSRGLVRKSATSGRENIYEATTELFSHLGIQNQEGLPEYAKTKDTIEDKMEGLSANQNE